LSVICLNCEGWGCTQCRDERDASKGGEQGLSPLEIENDRLRAQLEEAQRERDEALAELAALRVPRGAA
jgi:hypothetical protein